VLLVLFDLHHVNGLNPLFLSASISRMRASAAASFCLSVAISVAAVAVRSAIIACVSRGRANRALPPSGFAKIFDKAGIPSCPMWRDCASSARSAAGIARLSHVPTAEPSPRGNEAASQAQDTLGGINGSFAQPPGSRFAAWLVVSSDA
jgi:hypothetical protein